MFASGAIIYAYVGGNPVNAVDPTGQAVVLAPYIAAGVEGIAEALGGLGIASAVCAITGCSTADDNNAADKGSSKSGGQCSGNGPPNPHGKKGGPRHQDKINERINELKDQGHEHIGGGNLPEERIPTPGGDKSYRSPDITTIAPDGSINKENVGHTNADGSPISRETKALNDIESATGRRPGYTAYDR